MVSLTSAIVRECRARHAAGETTAVLAEQFGISGRQMRKVLTGQRWAVLPDERICDECGKPGIEPSRVNIRKLHVACAKARQSRQRFKTPQRHADHAYHALRDRPYLEALSWRIIWTRYRLSEGNFLRLLAWQQELCPCGKPFTAKPHVDHDHSCCPSVTINKSCGRCVRGLLHPRCNQLLAVIENNTDTIRPVGWVMKYLAEPPYQTMVMMLGPRESPSNGRQLTSRPVGRRRKTDDAYHLRLF
jgi:hypothetical protein